MPTNFWDRTLARSRARKSTPRTGSPHHHERARRPAQVRLEGGAQHVDPRLDDPAFLVATVPYVDAGIIGGEHRTAGVHEDVADEAAMDVEDVGGEAQGADLMKRVSRVGSGFERHLETDPLAEIGP